MGNRDVEKCIFPLTSLQIGDLQSYLSHLSLFIDAEGNHMYILVDNRPWLRDLVSRPAQFWQLMVTKSRLSPFANRRAKTMRKKTEDLSDSKSNSKTSSAEPKKFNRWFSLVDAATLSQKRALLPVKKLRNSLILNSELHRTLYGFIIFEVAWDDIRGINYVNELQTHTSLAIEAKVMKRWEFDSIAQAARCISSWFSGTINEKLVLKTYLDAAVGEVFYDAEEGFSKTSPHDDNESTYSEDTHSEENSPMSPVREFSVYPATMESRTSVLLHTPPPPTGPNKRRKVTKSGCTSQILGSSRPSESVVMADCEDKVEPMEYRDVLILSRFDDRDLPFRLRQIIMSDLRLLTLLESGLPSWVIFVQSYPGFCHLYRPWMCPLVRALYVLISVVTVLIGFYDLYKNVPLLKATASRLFGPLVDWIDTWEMVSRIRYLGTMLFLHNFEKAVTWFLMITRTTRSFLAILARPMAGPLLELVELLLPVWNVSLQIAESFGSVIWIVIETSCSLIGDLMQIVLQPVWFILSVIWSIVYTTLYPILWILWELLYSPIRLILVFASFVGFIFTFIYELLEDSWLFISSILQMASASEAAVSTYEVPMWRSLWNDLFSQIFKAIRSILNGLVAFFAACNRHRLSIYNHLQELIRRLFHRAESSHSAQSRHHQRTGQSMKTAETSRKKQKIHIS